MDDVIWIRYYLKKLQMDQIPNMNSTIWSQVLEKRIIRIIHCNYEIKQDKRSL